MQWLTDFISRCRIAREERHYQRDLHGVKRTWTLSGIQAGKNGAPTDAGLTYLHGVTLAEARDKIAAWYPRASVIHIDDVHYIITYRVS